MKILFIHQNFPGQYPHLARELVRLGHDVQAVTGDDNKQPRIVPTICYAHPAAKKLPHEERFVDQIARGEAVARTLVELKRTGYRPDAILGHPGWGETLFCKDVFPDAPQILQAEYYYRFDADAASSDRQSTLASAVSTSTRNAVMLPSLVEARALVAPTQWQARRFPALLQRLLHVIHEGVATDVLAPNAEASCTLQRGDLVIRAGDEVVTFVNRNLEPYRGYHTFMRALPAVLAARPHARAVIVGGDSVSYGPLSKDGRTWKATFLDEVRDHLPMDRVHFVGRIPRATLTALMQVSAAHVYMTMPFVLSWSLLEAMSAGAPVVASRTPPVEEVVRHGETGLLVRFNDHRELADTVIEVLANPDRHKAMRAAARDSIVARYDLRSKCLPAWLNLIESVVG